MKRFKFLLPVVLLSFCVTVLQATIIHVPDDYAKIQVAIYHAIDGDTVLVADGRYTGTYNRDIEFMGKAIVVMSENGPENCIIDCQANPINTHRGFLFRGNENSNSVLQGFTIYGGHLAGENNGAGICCINSSSPTIIDNIIVDNRAGGGEGGGIYCYQSNPSIINNLIIDNYGGEGGGICTEWSSPLISHNTIVENRAGRGGGLFLESSRPTLINNTIVGNHAGQGGGIWNWNSNTGLLNCILWGNTNNQTNGGLQVSYSDVQGGYPGTGNIDENPLLLYAYYPSIMSPCIDAGDPESEVPANGGDRIDMGAIEFFQRYNGFLLFEGYPDVAEAGSVVSWEVTLENPTPDPLTVDGWIDFSGPVSGTAMRAFNKTLPPGILTDTLEFLIPENVPEGIYTVKGRVGIHGEKILDSEVFDIEIIPGTF